MRLRAGLPILAIAGLAAVPAAGDDGARAGPDLRCGQRALPVCTRERVVALRALNAVFTRAAAQRAPSTADAAQLELLARDDRWLVRTSARAAELADLGQRTLGAWTRQTQEMQMSFNLQYLQLQNQMQHENRAFAMVSAIMSTKHDTVKKAIGNIR